MSSSSRRGILSPHRTTSPSPSHTSATSTTLSPQSHPAEGSEPLNSATPISSETFNLQLTSLNKMFRVLSRHTKSREERLKAEISELKAQLEGLEIGNKQLFEEVEELRKKKLELEIEINNEKEKRKEKPDDTKCEEIEKILKEATQELATVQIQLKKLMKERDETSAELRRVVKERDSTAEKLKKIRKQQEAAIVAQGSSTSPASPTTSTISKTSPEKLSPKSHPANLEATIVAQTMRIARLEKNRHDFETQISELETEKHQASEKITELTRDNNRLQDEKLALLNEDVRLRSENKHLKNGYEDLMEKYRKLKLEMDGMGGIENEEQQKQNQGNRQQSQQRNRSLSTDRSASASASSRNNNTIERGQDKTDKDLIIKDLKHEKLQLIDRNDELKDELNRSKLEHDRKIKEINQKLSSQKEQLTKMETDKEELIKASINQQGNHEQQIQKLKEENEKLKQIQQEKEAANHHHQEDPVKLLNTLLRKQTIMEERINQLEISKHNSNQAILVSIPDHAPQKYPTEINPCNYTAEDKAKLTKLMATVFPETVNELGFFSRTTPMENIPSDLIEISQGFCSSEVVGNPANPANPTNPTNPANPANPETSETQEQPYNPATPLVPGQFIYISRQHIPSISNLEFLILQVWGINLCGSKYFLHGRGEEILDWSKLSQEVRRVCVVPDDWLDDKKLWKVYCS